MFTPWRCFGAQCSAIDICNIVEAKAHKAWQSRSMWLINQYGSLKIGSIIFVGLLVKQQLTTEYL